MCVTDVSWKGASRKLLVALVLVCAGCAGSASTTSDAGVCTRSDPSCPAVVPSYKGDIAPIFTAECVPCHYPGNPYAQSNLVSYADVQHVYGESLGQVEACLMPPPGTSPLTAAERTAVLAWLACGAPDN